MIASPPPPSPHGPSAPMVGQGPTQQTAGTREVGKKRRRSAGERDTGVVAGHIQMQSKQEMSAVSVSLLSLSVSVILFLVHASLCFLFFSLTHSYTHTYTN